MGLSLSSVAIYSTGIIIEPVSREFGWTRTEITAGFTASILLTVPLSPLVGGLIDRWGVRRIALPGIIISGVALAAISLADGSSAQWLGLWLVYALAALMIKGTIWTASVTGAFAAARSMAISVILCGTAFAAVVVPPLMQVLTDNIGWREAYVITAAVWTVPTFILSMLYLREVKRSPARDDKQMNANGDSRDDLAGLSVQEAIRSIALWRIGISTLLMLVLSSGLLVHKVPLLTDAGVSRTSAALLASLGGVAGVVGKIVTGWMMERYDAGWVAAFTNGITALAMVLLLEPFQSPTTIVLAMLFVGYAGGTKLQICVYLTGIYAGMRNYGKIFGVMSSIIAAAGGLGPLIAGVAYDVFGGYGAFVAASIPISLLCAALLVGLGPFPEWSKHLQTGSRKFDVVGSKVV